MFKTNPRAFRSTQADTANETTQHHPAPQASAPNLTPATPIKNNGNRVWILGNWGRKSTPFLDIHSILAELDAASENPRSIKPEKLFDEIERVLKQTSTSESDIGDLLTKVQGLLDDIVFKMRTPEDARYMHKFFHYALPRRGNGATSVAHTKANAITTYREHVSAAVVNRYRHEISAMRLDPKFSTSALGAYSWQYQLLHGMKQLLEKRSLTPKALSDLADYMDSIEDKSLNKDFSVASDFIGEASYKKVCFLKDIKKMLEKHRTKRKQD